MSHEPRKSAQLFTHATTRRRFIRAAAAVAGAAVVTRAAAQAAAHDASASASPASGATPSTGAWTFTDDKGVTTNLPAPPVCIVADVNAAAPLWDFGIRPVAVFGWNANETGAFGPAGGNIDASTLQIVGDTSEPIKPEALVAQQPDAIMTLTWNPEIPDEYWSISEDILPQIVPIAPIIAISATGTADVNTERFAELAGLLGADLESPEIAAAKKDYAATLEKFPISAADKSDLTIVFVYVSTEAVAYIANAPDWADLTLYQNLGLDVVKPDAEDGSFWEEVSVEQTLIYPADVRFNSIRIGTVTLDEVGDNPTWREQPAVRSGRAGEWNQDFIMSYQGMTAALADTIAPINEAHKIT